MNGRFNFVLLFFYFIVVFPLGGKSDGNPLPISYCGGPTSNTFFDSNVNRDLFSRLNRSTVESGYSTAQVGQDGDELYGLAMCQPGMEKSDCVNCLNVANNAMVDKCPKMMNATILCDNCTLRYSNANLFSSLDDYSHCMRGVENATGEDQKSKLSALVDSSMSILSKVAAFNRSEKYAVGKVNLNSSVTLYELVQCTRNLSNEQCLQCLSNFVKLLLLPNCSSGSLGGRVLGQSCYLRFETNQFFPVINEEIPDLTDSPTRGPPPSTPARKYILMYVITSIVLVLIVSFSIFGMIKIRRVRRANAGLKTPPHDLENDENGIIGSFEIEQNTRIEPVQYSLATLQAVTENFSERKKLGGGAFGQVFEGIIDGEKVAIKKLQEDSVPSNRLLELGKEVWLLAPLCHRNLVKLLGFCIEAGHYILVYEFIENKDLGRHLKDSSLRQSLDWETRRRIIEEIANGLCYLHYESRNKKRIIHCDLKAENILLDERNVVKIGDFGLSRILKANKTHESSRVTVGTPGYIAPELWPPTPMYSPEADVYSFGVLLLELITKWTVFAYEGFLTHDVWEHWKCNAMLEMIDPYIVDDCSEDEALRFTQIGLLCVQGDRQKRPDMKNVVNMLRGGAFLHEPSYPGYYPAERQQQKKTWLSRIIKF
ncbi:cysteine-rich RECEPTOR-like kinase [Rhynchospora pubera]|uniref:non-specific serine/threonine protein kinase n=1 Tax=Rhynchospora pubera TaxID=906938 RepID=A0AAV8E3K5_9POAL|nr:cysteine-rich RECEPTOR-like kinase [Rhynchospora pubera]